MMRYFFLSFFFSIKAISAVPTPEGLLRHSGSLIPQGDLAVFTFAFKRNALETPLEINDAPKQSVEVLQEVFVKALCDTNRVKEKNVKCIFVYYQTGLFQKSDILKVSFVPNFFKKVQALTFGERKVVMATLSSFLFSSSSEILEIVQNYNPDFPSNTSLINKEKQELLNSYITYLKTKKDLPDDEALALENPFTPEDPEEKKRVKEIRRQRFYQISSFVKLKKEGPDFFWGLNLPGVEGRFTQTDYLMKSLVLTQNNERLEIKTQGKRKFGKGTLLPDLVEISFPQDREYSIRMIGLYLIEKSSKNFIERLSEYRKSEKKAGKEAILDSFPLFL